jgi:hypothetical protein
VRTFFAFNPGQDVEKRTTDEKWSDDCMAYLRQHMPRRGVLFSTSLASRAEKAKAPMYTRMYDTMKLLGGPRSIQTEQIGRVADWKGMLDYGVELGFTAIETSPGGFEKRMTPEQALTYSRLLAKNAVGMR